MSTLNDWIIPPKPATRLARKWGSSTFPVLLASAFPDCQVRVFSDRVLVASRDMDVLDVSDSLLLAEFGSIQSADNGRGIPAVWARPTRLSYLDLVRVAADWHDPDVLGLIEEHVEPLSESNRFSGYVPRQLPIERAKTASPLVNSFVDNFQDGMVANNRFGGGVSLRDYYAAWKKIAQ